VSDSLSAEQIAQLFAAANEGELPEDPHAQTNRQRIIRTVNFSRPAPLSVAEQRRLEQAHTIFCRDTSVRLSHELSAPVDLDVINSSQLTWEAALEEVPQPSIICVTACTPGETSILFCIEKTLVLRMIEHLLGGRYADTPPPRTLTAIDTALAEMIFERMLATLSPIWNELLGYELSLVEIASQNVAIELEPPWRPTLAITIEAHDESTSSTMMVLVPHTTIETSRKGLSDGPARYMDGREPDDEEAEAVRRTLRPISVEVRAELEPVGLTIEEVLALGEGDVVRLGIAGRACIAVGDSRLYAARPGLSGNRRAVQIVEALESGT